MKKLLLLLFLAPLFAFISTNNDVEKKIVGKWKGEDKGEVGYFIFDEKGYAYMQMNGQVVGGESFIFNGKKGKMTYKVNSTVSPIELDLIVNIIDENAEHKLKFIIEFIDDDSIKLASDFGETRPKVFTADNSLIFKREK